MVASVMFICSTTRRAVSRFPFILVGKDGDVDRATHTAVLTHDPIVVVVARFVAVSGAHDSATMTMMWIMETYQPSMLMPAPMPTTGC